MILKAIICLEDVTFLIDCKITEVLEDRIQKIHDGKKNIYIII